MTPRPGGHSLMNRQTTSIRKKGTHEDLAGRRRPWPSPNWPGRDGSPRSRSSSRRSCGRPHPLVDLCHAVSVAFAIPVAVFDISKITGHLDVRYAAGEEDDLTFSGELEHPGPMR
jgi:hypothetical protein